MPSRVTGTVCRGGWMVAVALILAACAGGAAHMTDHPVAIAVWDLEDLSPVTHGQAGMGEMLAGQIAARLDEAPAYQLLERQQLLKAMEELRLGSSELADPQTQLKLGRIIGARQMVFGAYQAVGGTLRIDLRRVEVASGKVLKTATAEAAVKDLGGWLRAADQAAGELVR